MLVVCLPSGYAASRNEQVFVALLAADIETNVSVKCTLLDLHERLGHLMYDIVNKRWTVRAQSLSLLIARDLPASLKPKTNSSTTHSQTRTAVRTHKLIKLESHL